MRDLVRVFGNVYLEVQEGDGRITLRAMVEKRDVRIGGEWNWFKIASNGGL
jgi:hypothetical protein